MVDTLSHGNSSPQTAGITGAMATSMANLPKHATPGHPRYS